MSNTEDIKLYNGDCLEIMDKLIEQGIKVDMILTDPPYGKSKWHENNLHFIFDDGKHKFYNVK